MQSLQNFLLWIYKKIIISEKDRGIQIREGDIYWCALGENIGDEENGKGEDFRRPVLVLRKFNNNLCVTVPLSSQNKDNKYYVQVEFNSQIQSVIISQIKTLDTKRFGQKIGYLNVLNLSKVRNEVAKMITGDNQI